MKKYFVSYFYVKPDMTFGFGNQGFETGEYVTHMEDIRFMESELARLGEAKPVVLNVQLLKDDIQP